MNLNPVVIAAEGDITPAVTLDKANNIFEIKGWSHPEDAIKFYMPVIDWIAQYKENPNAETNFHFHFQYFNTASARQILRLIMLLKDIKGATKIYWHSDAGDTDMEASGDRFSKMSSAPFEFVSH